MHLLLFRLKLRLLNFWWCSIFGYTPLMSHCVAVTGFDFFYGCWPLICRLEVARKLLCELLPTSNCLFF
jgi:hypothetical protein